MAELTVLLPTVTDIGPVVALCGTVIVSRARSALMTAAAVPLIRTLLSDGLGLNPLPTMATVAPTGPDTGKKFERSSRAMLLWIATMLPTMS